MGDDATAVGGGGAAGAAVPGATAGPTATTSPPSSDRDPDLEPLLRRWPGGGRVSWLLAFAVLLVLLFGGLLGVSGFPPALVGEDGTVTLARRLALSFRLIAAAGVWSLAAWGVCLGFAWGQDREVGGRIELGGRMVLAVAASRLAILLPIGEPGLAFLAEGLLVLVILTLGLRLAIRVTWAMAGGLAIMTAFAIGSTALIAHVLAWILA